MFYLPVCQDDVLSTGDLDRYRGRARVSRAVSGPRPEGRLLQSRDKMNSAELRPSTIYPASPTSLCPLPPARVQTNCHASMIRALGLHVARE